MTMPTTSTVIVENSDCKIWHKEQVIAELLCAMHQNNDLIISLNNEGPCAESLGLYSLLDMLCVKTGYNYQKIIIRTCNLIEHSNKYQIEIRAPIKHIEELKQLILQDKIPKKKIVKHFGHFIGHSSRFRLSIASWLYKYHSDKTLQTFHSAPCHELHREFIGLEDLWFHTQNNQYVDNAVDFLKKCPFYFDQPTQGPIQGMKMYGILDAYEHVFLDIVNNTNITGRTFYMDEKIWRPIISKTPFLVHGSKNFIKNLRELGFKTFDKWWDEGYSEDPPDCQTVAMIDIIDQLSTLPIDKIEKMYDDMQNVLEHNLKTFLSLVPLSFHNKKYHTQ